MNNVKTEKLAISRGMKREVDLDQKCTHCPECGCPWFGNENLCGEGARVCWNCHQDWYVHTKYNGSAKLKELPKSRVATKMIDWKAFADLNNMSELEFKQEIMIVCGSVMTTEMDNNNSDGMKFTFSDDVGKLELLCRRVK